MGDAIGTSGYLDLLNNALARELQASLQYMLQHSIGAGLKGARLGGFSSDAQGSFIASHALYFIPGSSLKKIAITEMRHAEAISERIVLLGGSPTTRPHDIVMGRNALEMLQNNRAAEQEAIDLYTGILVAAETAADATTAHMFRKILSDERRHHKIFSDLLERGPHAKDS